jgi:hypothetical protein
MVNIGTTYTEESQRSDSQQQRYVLRHRETHEPSKTNQPIVRHALDRQTSANHSHSNSNPPAFDPINHDTENERARTAHRAPTAPNATFNTASSSTVFRHMESGLATSSSTSKQQPHKGNQVARNKANKKNTSQTQSPKRTYSLDTLSSFHWAPSFSHRIRPLVQ